MPNHLRRVLLLGAAGQLGHDLGRQLERRAVEWRGLDRQALDVRDRDAVFSVMRAYRPHVVINAAAFTNVDQAETHEGDAFAVNALGARNVAIACRELEALPVYISTDYVFSGQLARPYVESDAVGPLNVYGASKLAGEALVIATSARHLIMRSSGLYGAAGSRAKGGNFVETMLKLGKDNGQVSVVTDQVVSPTSTVELAASVVGAAVQGVEGLWHAAAAGTCSWYEFAVAIFEIARMPVSVRRIQSLDLRQAARRPAFSALDSCRLSGLGVPSPGPWRAGLEAYMEFKRYA